MNNDNAIKNVDVKAYMKANNIEKPRELKKIYAVKDTDMGFLDVYSVVNDVIAIRNFGMQAKENKQLSAFAEKFELYKLGELDVYSGEFISDIRKLATATDFRDLA